MTARLDVLVVSSWYPAVDAPSAGRFVADQVGALEEPGRVSPWVAWFDPAPRLGSRRLRLRWIERGNPGRHAARLFEGAHLVGDESPGRRGIHGRIPAGDDEHVEPSRHPGPRSHTVGL